MNAYEIAKAIESLDIFDTYHAWDSDLSEHDLIETIVNDPDEIIEWLEENDETELANEVRALQEI